jgi:hypothetical protein
VRSRVRLPQSLVGLLPSKMTIKGRQDAAQSTKYLSGLARSSTRERFVCFIAPAAPSATTSDTLRQIASELARINRVGVVDVKSKPGAGVAVPEIYLLPYDASAPPAFLPASSMPSADARAVMLAVIVTRKLAASSTTGAPTTSSSGASLRTARASASAAASVAPTLLPMAYSAAAGTQPGYVGAPIGAYGMMPATAAIAPSNALGAPGAAGGAGGAYFASLATASPLMANDLTSALASLSQTLAAGGASSLLASLAAVNPAQQQQQQQQQQQPPPMMQRPAQPGQSMGALPMNFGAPTARFR